MSDVSYVDGCIPTCWNTYLSCIYIRINFWNTRYWDILCDKKDSLIIKWFWEIVNEFNHKQRVKLLKFVTGIDRVPQGGFAGLRGASGINLKFNTK